MTAACSLPLRADARRNRELILDAADKAFAEEGLGVPVDEIARRAGVGAGTLYRHFPTKEALFQAVLVAHLDEIAERARELAEREDADEALFEFMTCLGGEAASKKNLIDALAGAGVDVHQTAPESKRSVEDAFRKLLSRAQATGSIRSDVTIDDLFGLIMGTCAMGNPASDASQARMLAIVCAGLRASPAPTGSAT
ncbi:MAG TPA: helix-turn-helix domain-containing protein [Acidimicrobiales bacterium]